MNKGLIALDVIKSFDTLTNGLDKMCFRGACDIIEKELKALEIVKKNNLTLLTDMTLAYDKGYITKEEHDLVVEVLGNE